MIDQDPNETAQISGSDFAQMCDEMKQLRAERDEARNALTGNLWSEWETERAATLGRLAAAQQTVVRLRAALEGMMEAEMALSQAEGWSARDVEAEPHWKAARAALAQ